MKGLVVITGVSGSGKSTLVSDIITPAIKNKINNKTSKDITYKNISFNDKDILDVEFINQKPIGRSSRSNPVTYTKVYDDIRKLFAQSPLAKKEIINLAFFLLILMEVDALIAKEMVKLKSKCNLWLMFI